PRGAIGVHAISGAGLAVVRRPQGGDDRRAGGAAGGEGPGRGVEGAFDWSLGSRLMKKADFEELNEPHWRELEATLAGLEKRTVPPSTRNFPKLFRQACGDLAMAQHRMYGKRL